MDVATHALASLAASRAVWPRAPKMLWAWTIPAGIVADLDGFSAMVGAATHVAWYRTYAHSVATSLLIAGALALLYRFAASQAMRQRLPIATVYFGSLLAQWLHLGMDAAQWQGVELGWPFSIKRVAADWLPSVDPWIIAILIVAITLPEFLHLVTSEIGAKDVKPRGRLAAILGLSLIAMYIGLRAELHSSAIAQLQNRSYAGESPRKVAAYSELTSLVSWRGVADSESALHQVTVKIGVTRASALDAGINLYKPEPSALLDAAQKTPAALKFLQVARFPKATVLLQDSGTEVQIRDVRYSAAEERAHEPMVTVDFDALGKITSQEITWATRESAR
jgi:membrane-bound metal-dependent hydrolase YbcI (DUF457 family)